MASSSTAAITYMQYTRFDSVCAGNLMVVALADISGLQKVATFTLNNLFQPGDTIHTTYVEDTANSGVLQTLAQLRDACEAVSM